MRLTLLKCYFWAFFGISSWALYVLGAPEQSPNSVKTIWSFFFGLFAIWHISKSVSLYFAFKKEVNDNEQANAEKADHTLDIDAKQLKR